MPRPGQLSVGQRSGDGRLGEMTYYEAACQILQQADGPLTVGEITEQAVRTGLIEPVGKTPVASMSAVLYLRLGADTRLRKLEERSGARARRGTVRWQLVNDDL